MKSCDILWISWNPVAISKILLDLTDFIKSFEISGFHEILLPLIKLCWISWNCVKSCWFQWNLIGYHEIHNKIWYISYEILLDFMKSCEILLDFMKFCEILWIYEIQQISVQMWWTSGGFQIMQISFRFIADFICRFQCGLHYGFHCWFYRFQMKSTWFHMKD